MELIPIGISDLQSAPQRVSVRRSSPTASTLSIRCDGGFNGSACTSKENMNTELKYPQWQMPFEDALLDPTKLLDIETVIRKRLHLITGRGHLDEQQALTDALSTIRLLKRAPSVMVNDASS